VLRVAERLSIDLVPQERKPERKRAA